jgi:flagellum-specific ATP synthase
MERAIAERGRYPSINVLKSVSRSMPRSTAPAYLEVLARARKVMATIFRYGRTDPAWLARK